MRCFPKKLCTRHDAWAGVLSCWRCQSPVARSCSRLHHPESFCGGMFKLNTKFDADLLFCLHTMATQYTCSLKGVYHPHWLVQWSHHCSCMRIPVHSLWLSSYVDVWQTVLIILTMNRFFWQKLVYIFCWYLHNCILLKKRNNRNYCHFALNNTLFNIVTYTKK